MHDALVIGKGPAALAAAAALSGRGLAVCVLGPAGAVRWSARYAAWHDELEAAGAGDAVLARWPAAVVDAGDGRRHVLPRPYAMIDNERLAHVLASRCEAGRVRWTNGEAARAAHSAAGSTVTLADGREIRARLVVDATGHRPALVRRAATPRPAFQTAVGWTIEARAIDIPAGEMVLMDWRDGHVAADDGAGPSFLYAARLPGGLAFVEETSLAACPAMPFDVLERRLKARLATLGAGSARPITTERVWIPMGGGLPLPRQRVVGFGAAAGMVHPATGYSVARSLTAAPLLADAVARVLSCPGATPADAAREAWRAVWPADARRRYALYRLGLDALVAMSGREAREFFHCFFRRPPREWGGYLSDALGAAEIVGMMSRLYAGAPPSVRAALTRPLLGRTAAALAARIPFRSEAGFDSPPSPGIFDASDDGMRAGLHVTSGAGSSVGDGQ